MADLRKRFGELGHSQASRGRPRTSQRLQGSADIHSRFRLIRPRYSQSISRSARSAGEALFRIEPVAS
jgi:hypothetical protein